MPTTFDKLAKKVSSLGFTLVKRENFNTNEEIAAGMQEAKASTGLSRTMRINYCVRQASGGLFFFSLRSVGECLKNFLSGK